MAKAGKTKESHISQSAAAREANVTQQTINKLRRDGTRSFFTKTGKVDTNHPDWKSYLRERNAKEENAQKRESYKSAKRNPMEFNWIDEVPQTIQEEKIYADIIQKKIAIMQDLELLIEKRIVVSAFGEIIKAAQSNLVDFGKRTSPVIAAKLGLPGTEKTIEKIINEGQKKNIENFIYAISKAIDKIE